MTAQLALLAELGIFFVMFYAGMEMDPKELLEHIKPSMAAAVGGSAFQLSGCDPAVRDTMLVGLETTTLTLSDALITAFFLSLEDDSSSDGSGLTTTSLP